MTKKAALNLIAITSTLGVLCWIAADYFGGMVIFLLTYGTIVVPILILYAISFFDTLISVIKSGIKQNKIKLVAHIVVIVAIFLTMIYQSDLLKSERVLTATLKDDQFLYTLILRKNGDCENKVSGIFGSEEVFHGKYKFKGDTIVFEKKPYDNDFLPDTLFLNRKEKAIFITRDKSGKFSTKKEWLNHFKLH